MPRYAPERSFPSYAFTPGENTHPNKEGGHSFGLQELISTELSLENRDYLFSIDLINNQYFWEAHVYLEAIWNVHKRKGSKADFCKGLIKMSAAAIKFRLGSKDSFNGHLERAIDLFESIKEVNLHTGIEPSELILICRQWQDGNFTKLELQLS